MYNRDAAAEAMTCHRRQQTQQGIFAL